MLEVGTGLQTHGVNASREALVWRERLSERSTGCLESSFGARTGLKTGLYGACDAFWEQCFT